MHTHTRRTFIIAVMLAASVITQAQTATKKDPTASVTGRVTIGDKPAAGITVIAGQPFDFPQRGDNQSRSVTDADGRFRITNLPAGRYSITPFAPTLVPPADLVTGRAPGKTLNLSDGEAIEDIDFALTRGGVITGRVVDADGRAVVEERVNLLPANDGERQTNRGYYLERFSIETDDRGIYRMYGLPAGRYKVSVGEGGDEDRRNYRRGRGSYTRTFHPNVLDGAKAEIIEVAEGGEASGVDITLGKREETFTASGKVVDAETGKPVSNVELTFGELIKGEKRFTSSMSMNGLVNARGEFQIGGLSTGRYAVGARAEGGSNLYGEPVSFEIADADASGIVIKLRHGGILSGVVVVENTTDRSVLAKLSQLRLFASVSSAKGESSMSNRTTVAADGSFRIDGLSAGKVRLYPDLLGYGYNNPALRGFLLSRFERDGVEIKQEGGGFGIEIGDGEQVGGIRIVLAYGTGRVRGQVRIEGGTLPTGAHMHIQIRRAGDNNMRFARPVEVDARGHFLIENLVAGEHQLTLNISNERPSERSFPIVNQTVTVTDGVEAETTIVVNLAAENGEKQP